MKYYLAIFIFVSCILNYSTAMDTAMNDEDFLGYPEKLEGQIFHEYQENKVISVKEDSNLGQYTLSFGGGKTIENAEIKIDGNNFTLLEPMKSSDGIYEFFNPNFLTNLDAQKTDKPKGKQQESAEFGKLDKVKRTEQIPYKFVGNLLITFPHSRDDKNSPGVCIGSGVLIGPNHVLTAGHNIFDHERGGWAKDIVFTPGQNSRDTPFPKAKGKILKVFKKWTENKTSYDYDMGLIILDKRIGDKVGWAGLLCQKTLEETFLNWNFMVVGYPVKQAKIKEVKTESSRLEIQKARMFKHVGKVVKVDERRLCYKISTEPGQSGGPIFAVLQHDGIKKFYILGIHTHGIPGTKDPNEGTRITSLYLNRIIEEVNKSTLLELDYSTSTVLPCNVNEVTSKIIQSSHEQQGALKISTLLNTTLTIPLVARGYEEIYQKFLNGKLIYKPNKDKDNGKIELRISDLTNPLEGTFDLSRCGDTGKYLSISTGYRKGKKVENAGKVEIWFVPRFLIEKEFNTTAKHFQEIFPAKWPETAPIGIFWTFGEWNDLTWFDYLTLQSFDYTLNNNLLTYYKDKEKKYAPYEHVHAKSMKIIGCIKFYERFHVRFVKCAEDNVNEVTSKIIQSSHEQQGALKISTLPNTALTAKQVIDYWFLKQILPYMEKKHLTEVSLILPPIVQGYEEIYQKFLNGKLIYKPNKDNDIGKIELCISDLANPLEGTFDLSRCGDAGKYLSISTGYRKGKKPENANKIEIWFAPRFLVEKEINGSAQHLKPIFSNEWSEKAPVGIFWTWGGWDNMEQYDYLTEKALDGLSADSLYTMRNSTRHVPADFTVKSRYYFSLLNVKLIDKTISSLMHMTVDFLSTS